MMETLDTVEGKLNDTITELNDVRAAVGTVVTYQQALLDEIKTLKAGQVDQARIDSLSEKAGTVLALAKDINAADEAEKPPVETPPEG